MKMKRKDEARMRDVNAGRKRKGKQKGRRKKNSMFSIT